MNGKCCQGCQCTNCSCGWKISCKTIAISIIILFIWIFLSDGLVHGKLLAHTYQDTASLWRTPEAMQSFMVWMVAGQALFAVLLAKIFVYGYQKAGWCEGARYGLLMGVFASTHCLIQYAVTPIPISLLIAWVITMMVQSVVSGILLAVIYGKCKFTQELNK